MKYISLRLFFALLTFFIGITLTTVWIFNREIPNVPIPKSEEFRNSNFDSRIPLSEKVFWEREIFTRFKEVSLEKLPESIDESYRLILIPTFDSPVIVRIWRSENGRFLTAKKLSGEGGFGIKKFGKLSYEKTQSLTEEKWNNFIKLLDAAFFMDLPPLDKNDVELVIEDGSTWVIEGVQNNVYHEVHRYSPSKEFRASGTYLLELSGLEADYEGY